MLKTKILEAWAILRILNTGRMVNAFKAILFYLWGRITKRVYLHYQPLALSVEPTSICNLRCPECPTGTRALTRPAGNMTLEKYQAIIDQLPKELMYLNLYVQGEPTMHPGFATMVKLAVQKKLYTSTSTNGHFIDAPSARQIVEAGLTRIIFSVDGTTQESYSRYRKGGDLARVISSIKHMTQAKSDLKKKYPLIVIQFLVFEHNEHEFDAIKKLANELNADKLELKTAQFNNYTNTSVSPPKNTKFSRYENKHQLKLKGKMINKCWRQWHSAVITWDGQMAPCCYDKDADNLLGTLSKSSFGKIWKSKENKHFKELIFKNKSSISICHNCPEGRSIRH